MRDDPLLVFDEAENYMFIWKQVHRFLMNDVKVCCRGCSPQMLQSVFGGAPTTRRQDMLGSYWIRP